MSVFAAIRRAAQILVAEHAWPFAGEVPVGLAIKLGQRYWQGAQPSKPLSDMKSIGLLEHRRVNGGQSLWKACRVRPCDRYGRGLTAPWSDEDLRALIHRTPIKS